MVKSCIQLVLMGDGFGIVVENPSLSGNKDVLWRFGLPSRPQQSGLVFCF